MPVAVATDFSALSQLAVALCPSNANIPINGQAEAGAIKKAVVGENHAQLPRQAKGIGSFQISFIVNWSEGFLYLSVAKVVKAAKAVQRDMPSVKAFYTINRQLNLLLATRPPIKSSISISKFVLVFYLKFPFLQLRHVSCFSQKNAVFRQRPPSCGYPSGLTIPKNMASATSSVTVSSEQLSTIRR